MTDSLGLRVAQEIRAEVARQGVTKGRLADAVDLSPGQLSRRLSGRIPLTLHDLEALSLVLNVAPTEFVRRALEPAAA